MHASRLLVRVEVVLPRVRFVRSITINKFILLACAHLSRSLVVRVVVILPRVRFVRSIIIIIYSRSDYSRRARISLARSRCSSSSTRSFRSLVDYHSRSDSRARISLALSRCSSARSFRSSLDHH